MQSSWHGRSVWTHIGRGWRQRLRRLRLSVPLGKVRILVLLLGRRNNEFYSEDPTDLDMSDRDFEKFMKTVTDIKVDMMTILADPFRGIAQVKQ